MTNVYLMCGWYRHDDGMADFYEVEGTLTQAKTACLEHLRGWLDTEDSPTLEWEENNPERWTAVVDGDLVIEGDDYIYEIMQREVTTDD